MNLRSKLIFWTTVALVFGLLCFTLGRRSVRTPSPSPERVRVDTLVVRDTITRERPVYVRAYVRDSIYIYRHDTLYVTLPREVKVYEDSNYRAEVSGYEPSLDRIDVYPTTRTITQTVTRTETVKKRTPWGVGVQVGYGKYGSEFYPGMYVGVGLSYNLLRW